MFSPALATAGLTLLLVAGSAAAGELTLAGAYALAVAKSESIGMAEAEWSAAEARYRQAVGAMWPEVTARGETTRAGDTSATRAGLGVGWTVFNGFRNARTADARRQEGLAQSNAVERARQLLYEDVADVFFQVLSCRAQRAASEEQLKTLAARSAELDRRLQLGLAKRSDLLATSNQAAEVRLALAELDQSHAAAAELLGFLTGRDAADLQPCDRSPLPDPGRVETYLAAVDGRADLRAGEALVAAAAAEAAAARAERLPRVTLDGTASPLRDPEEQDEWDLTLRVELPLFDGGTRTAKGAERWALSRVSELRLAGLRRSARLDVRQAYQAVYYGLRQWAELQAAIAVATETLAVVRKDYELGRVNNLEVLSASFQLWGLRLREAARAQQLRAGLVHLHVAAGSVSP